MATKFLASEQLPALLEALAREARVVTPTKSDGLVQFEVWEPGKAVELQVLLARQSPKEWVFPQCETYLRFEYTMAPPEETQAAVAGDAPAQAAAAGAAPGAAPAGDAPTQAAPAIPHETIRLESLNEAPRQVIFGLRPCDARGFVQMDQVFGGYGGFYFDPLYNARREATTLLAVTCREPRSTCFCTAVGGCPAGQEGVDALFTEVEAGFVVEVLTTKGEAALAAAASADVLSDASEVQVAEAAEVKMAASAKVESPFTLEGIGENLRANFADGRWHELCLRCISCGTCTYVCPNCYCFSINDSLVETRGERYRTWDNCFNPQYTEETSGHNPRAHKANRFRNRFSHKFWYYPEKYDSLLCSGCGRCIMHCPTRIDIREVLRVMGAPAAAPASAGVAASSAPAAAGPGADQSAATEGKEA